MSVVVKLREADKQPNSLEIEVKNISGYPIRFLNWRTPFDKIQYDFLNVDIPCAGRMPYIGKRVKRIFIPEYSTTLLKPDETFRNSVDLGDNYNLEASTYYNISLDFNFIPGIRQEDISNELSLSDFQSMPVKSDDINIFLSPFIDSTNIFPKIEDVEIDKSKLEKIKREGAGPRCPPFFMCGHQAYHVGGICYKLRYIGYIKITNYSAHHSQIIQDSYVNFHKKYIDKKNIVENDTIFKKWFGPYNSSSAAHVRTTVSAILSQTWCKKYVIMGSLGGCTGDAVAWFRKSVDPTRFSVMSICRQFFSLSQSGYNSKGGSIAHELSHGYGDTQDYYYGTEACLRLALHNPEHAINNADNYQYYLEEKLAI